jgi:uncharacterized alpha-E superfamily protein
MLSRVAESVHWMARYLERAEDLTRVLAVHTLALLDAPGRDAERGFRALVAFLGDEADFLSRFDRFDGRTLSAYFVADPLNPSGIVACIGRARENARAVREQISSEMWEHLNRLYFAVKDAGPDDFAQAPYEFYRRIRDGSQAFQGITHATMTHNEAYGFLQLGKHLERTSQTLRLLRMRYGALSSLEDGTPGATLELIAMLKACSAFEPFRQSGARLTTAGVTEFLLVHRHFPRAVLFCLKRSAEALGHIAERVGGSTAPRPDRARQLLGQIVADLEFLDVGDLQGPAMLPFLDPLLQRVHLVGEELARAYFSTRIVLPRTRGAQAGVPEQQQQQQ